MEDYAYETVIRVTYSPTLGLRYAREGYPQRVKQVRILQSSKSPARAGHRQSNNLGSD